MSVEAAGLGSFGIDSDGSAAGLENDGLIWERLQPPGDQAFGWGTCTSTLVTFAFGWRPVGSHGWVHADGGRVLP